MLSFRSLVISGVLPFFLLSLSLNCQKLKSKGETKTEIQRVTFNQEYELWQKINLQGLTVGYAVFRVKGNMIQENMNMIIRALGSSREVKTSLVWYKEPDFSLKSFVFDLETNDSKNSIIGGVYGGKLSLRIGPTTKEIEIKNKVYTGAAYIFLLSNKIISGNYQDGLEIPYFDPSVLRFDILKIKYEKKDTAGLIVFSKSYAGIVSKLYFSDKGDFVKEEGPAGIELLKSNYEDVISSLKTDVDIIFSTSSRAEGSLPTKDRRDITYVKLLVEGVDRVAEFLPFQTVSKDGEKFYVSLRKEYLYEKSVSSSYILPEPLIESDSEEIRRLARQISSGKKNPVEIAKSVSDWVYGNLEKVSVLSMPSAVEVLRSRRGDCNEHAILSVAILRALKIPSRVAFGLVYNEGAFFYHAWVEFYDGEKWISFDPTWGLFPADILRIKIGDGNVSEWIEVLKYVGKIKITFIEWKT